ncbi:MAG: Mov34/MPN/PAD-1 family protein [Phycisphaerae bacterium]
MDRFDADLKDIYTLLRDGRLREVYAHARDAYPAECCGMILRSGVRYCENAQAALQRLEPERHEKAAARAFQFDAADAIFLAESFDSDDPALVVYHSHTTGAAVFSRADRSGALLLGKPTYPNLCHLVIDCRSDRVAGARLFRFDRSDFVEIARLEGMDV